MPQRRQVRTLVVMIVGSTLIIAAISLVGFSSASDSAQRDHKTLVKVDETQQLTVYNAARAECIREAGSTLDEARWHAVGKLIASTTRAESAAAGRDLIALPNVFDLITKGGSVGDEHIAACPPVVKKLPTSSG